MSYSRYLGLALITGLLMFGFQNCSDVGFKDSGSASTKVVDPGELEGTPLDENNGDAVMDELDQRDRDGIVIPDDAARCDDDDDSSDDGAGKVYLCHFPPGNPAALHTICVGIPAVQAHLNHGNGEVRDVLGRCEDLF